MKAEKKASSGDKPSSEGRLLALLSQMNEASASITDQDLGATATRIKLTNLMQQLQTSMKKLDDRLHKK